MKFGFQHASNRRKVFSKDMLDDMRGVFASVCTDFEAELIEMDGEDAHVHLRVNYPPKIPLTKLVNSLKGVSSRRMRQMHPTLRPRYWKGVLWSPSYFAASCDGAPISIIRQYIEGQRNPQSDSYRRQRASAPISGVTPRSLLP